MVESVTTINSAKNMPIGSQLPNTKPISMISIPKQFQLKATA
ncbi:MAG: hypothetical protein WCO91_10750 [Gemmataceae bacterium]